MKPVIDEQLALRLGLAAKAIPQIPLKKFIDHLINELGAPLSGKKLRSLSPKKLHQSLINKERDIERSQSNQVYAVLTNEDITDMSPPEVPAAKKLCGNKLRVAISSNNQEQLDGHFGSCLRFLIYEVNATKFNLVDVRPVVSTESGLMRTDHLIELIKDCHILMTLSIGGPAAAKVVRADIHPVKHAAPCNHEQVLNPLSDVIAGTPPPWIVKIFEKEESHHECSCHGNCH